MFSRYKRAEVLTSANIDLLVEEWKAKEAILRADTEMKNRIAYAEADYLKRTALADSAVDALAAKMSAEVDRFKAMKDAVGSEWKPKHMLQWKHSEAIEHGGAAGAARVFADYSRETMVLEAAL